MSRSSRSDEHGRHANGRKIRADALPEHTSYRDHGCQFAPSCLDCPFSTCLYEKFRDLPVAIASLQRIALLPSSLTHAQADRFAAKFNITRRQVYRLQRVKRGLSPVPGLRAASANKV